MTTFQPKHHSNNCLRPTNHPNNSNSETIRNSCQIEYPNIQGSDTFTYTHQRSRLMLNISSWCKSPNYLQSQQWAHQFSSLHSVEGPSPLPYLWTGQLARGLVINVDLPGAWETRSQVWDWVFPPFCSYISCLFLVFVFSSYTLY